MKESMEEVLKPKQKNNKKVFFIIIGIVIAMIAIAGIVIAFMLNYNVYAPSNLRVIDDGKNVYVAVDMNDNYLKYKFSFTNGEDEIVIESDKNILTIEQLQEQGIEIGKNYTITVTYIGENEGNNSQTSQPISWTAYKYLVAPELSYISEEDKLMWTIVDNADYYMVYINGLDSIKTTDNYINLQTIEGGERSIYVVAMSNNQNYKSSLASNEISVKVVHNILPITSVSFDSDKNTITATGYEKLEKLNVYLDDNVYECENFVTEYDNGIYTFIINVSLFYQNNQKIGVSPITVDEYNVYLGSITYAE